MLHYSKNFREHWRTLQKSSSQTLIYKSNHEEDFFQRVSKFIIAETVLLNIAPLRRSIARNVQTNHHGDFSRTRLVKRIKFTQVYDKE